MKVVGSCLSSSGYRGKFVLSNFPHSVPRTRTLSTVNIEVSTTLDVRITSRTVIRHVDKHEVYSTYNTSCRMTCGPPGATSIYSTYSTTLCVESSSGTRAILDHLSAFRGAARPLGSCCTTGKLLVYIRNRRGIRSAATTIVSTLTGFRTWSGKRSSARGFDAGFHGSTNKARCKQNVTGHP